MQSGRRWIQYGRRRRWGQAKDDASPAWPRATAGSAYREGGGSCGPCARPPCSRANLSAVRFSAVGRSCRRHDCMSRHTAAAPSEIQYPAWLRPQRRLRALAKPRIQPCIKLIEQFLIKVGQPRSGLELAREIKEAHSAVQPFGRDNGTGSLPARRARTNTEEWPENLMPSLAGKPALS